MLLLLKLVWVMCMHLLCIVPHKTSAAGQEVITDTSLSGTTAIQNQCDILNTSKKHIMNLNNNNYDVCISE